MQDQYHHIDSDVQQMTFEQLGVALDDLRARRDRVAGEVDDIVKQFERARLDLVRGGGGADRQWLDETQSLRHIKEAALRKINRRMQGMERRYGELTRERRAKEPKTGDQLFVQAAGIVLDQEAIETIWRVVRTLSTMAKE